jgi:hypothetical protein
MGLGGGKEKVEEGLNVESLMSSMVGSRKKSGLR